jgi:5-methylcytosine-specific restriction enzyme subunit McrC
MTELTLQEWETVGALTLTDAQVAALAGDSILRVEPDATHRGRWKVTAQSHVGVICLEGLTIRIRPKVAIPRLLGLMSRHLGRVSFRTDTIDIGVAEDLTAMTAATFANQVERLLGGGLLSGYRSMDDALYTIRGRIDMGRHVAARAGLPLPVEVTYDDFTTDILENRLLAGATARLLRVGGLDDLLRTRLRRIAALLHEITPVIDPAAADQIQWSRLNERYRVPVGLAVIILRATSIEDAVGDRRRAGSFLVNMNQVFEDEVILRLREGCQDTEMAVVAKRKVPLDREGRFHIEPDIALVADGRMIVIADAKYKRVDLSGPDIADLYQVLAYAHRFALHDVHLVYPMPPSYPWIDVGEVRVHLHQVDLTRDDDLTGDGRRLLAAITPITTAGLTQASVGETS